MTTTTLSTPARRPYLPRHARQASMVRPYLLAHEQRRRAEDARRTAARARRLDDAAVRAWSRWS
ncbi:hypothetical protein HDA32_002757 [Spinactinospora alkalitolerans]|uniref:Uncharacterized protein n=1 Tax=Spinactinospora alkalitolerans TaxID=687207 RepID=A0A852TWE7_9ACTN|nr:hypothetical protein [Spinactinospora alkalitolerans]NYE47637.1 hypothetical protein [Spinactinospora alkalitolerans]